MTNRRHFCAAALALVAGGAARAAQDGSATGLVRAPSGAWVAPDIARVLRRGELVVAMLAVDSPPFFQVREGRLVGTDVRMAERLAAEMSVPVRIVRTARTFDEVIQQVARSEADMGISKLSRTLARSQAVRFSDPYLRLQHALILNRLEFAKYANDVPLVDVLRSYAGTLGVIANSSFAGYAPRNFPKAKIVSFPNWEEAVEGVKRGRVTALYRDEFEVRRIVVSDPALALTLRVVTLRDLEDTLGIALGWRDTALLALANQFLSQPGERLTVDKALAELKGSA
ncbi:substrate-binding periplasmic protein [Ramlibacter albus]|uniref:Transporter substrate-binding domain-containing protein n=1 Tax=Ramlibacter albus TaxID=2079448 RepID=A0A923S1J7_9BURK|nr:transporter substrate-binding domain-containing protein [Ramlibacter albus]MBC5764494.1 transporter substrate-binding domain-containing protein [Ramlibacter albus]